jgi:hypothetical protein
MGHMQLPNEVPAFARYLAHELHNPREQRQSRVISPQPVHGNVQLHGRAQHTLQ